MALTFLFNTFSGNGTSGNGSMQACNHVDGTIATALRTTTITTAVLILLGLSFTVQRKKILQDLLWGLPGIVVPVNLLTHNPRRIISMLVLAIMSGDILKFFFNYEGFVTFSGISSCYVQSFLRTVVSPVLLISYISIKFFPLLACVGVIIPMLGPALGLLYSILVISSSVYGDVYEIYCRITEDSSQMFAIFLSVRAPIYLASAIVFLWFLWELLMSLNSVCRKGFQGAMAAKYKEVCGSSYYFSCVRHLLKRRTADTLPVRHDTYTYKAVALFLPFWLSPRRLPLKFIGAMMIAFLMIYQLSLLFFGLFLKGLVAHVTLIKDKKETIILDYLTPLEDILGDADTVYETILEFVQGLAVVIPASPVIGMIICFILLFHLYITVYKDTEQAAKGKFKFATNLWPTLQISYSWRYPGYQIAFAFTAFIIYSFWLSVSGMVGIFAYFAFKHATQESLCVLSSAIIVVLWVGGIILTQIILAKIAFIEDSRGKFIVLTNQRVYHWVSYFLFIYDAISGLLTAILRIFLTYIFSLLLMVRLDRVVLMKGFEFCDIGYKAYVGFVHINHAYNNPVVHAFLQLLSDNSPRKSTLHSSTLVPDSNMRLLDYWDTKIYRGESDTSGKKIHFSPNRMRNRWLVAYTLIRNPSLLPLTASGIRQQYRCELQAKI